MAFTLTTTVGSKSANSFVTVAQADAYLASSPYTLTQWAALTTEQKNLRLILAAKDMTQRLTWKGWKLHRNQALAFPRWWQHYQDVDTNTVSPYGNGYSPGDLFIPDWSLFNADGSTADVWWTDERIATYDVIPEEIKIAQSWMAFAVEHPMLAGLADPTSEETAAQAIDSVDLFGGKLKVKASSKAPVYADNSSLAQWIRNKHGLIYTFIEGWLTQISMGPAPMRWPPLLDEVA